MESCSAMLIAMAKDKSILCPCMCGNAGFLKS